MVDIRDEERVAEAVHEAAEKSGGIDILINKASYPGGTASAPATTSTTLLPIPRPAYEQTGAPPRVLLWDRRWHPSRPERRPAVPPIKARRRPGSSLSPSAGRKCL